MKKKLLVMNWKMNPNNLSQALKLAKISDKKGVVLCPPFVFLNEIKKNIKNAKIGAQNSFWENDGAYTGEISNVMLKKIGCRYIIVGHSERRNILKESNNVINEKIKSILKENLKPILCIGENEKEKKRGETKKVLKKQLFSVFSNLKNHSSIIVAYEPIWSISGSGNSCYPKDAEKTRIFIENYLSQKLKRKNTTILYGGNVNFKNYDDFLKNSFFDGFLIGGASLKEKELKKILNL